MPSSPRLRRLVAGLVLPLAVAASTVPAAGAASADPAASSTELQRERTAAEAAAAELGAQVDDLRRRTAEAVSHLEELEARISQAVPTARTAAVELDAATQVAAAERAARADRARELYKAGGTIAVYSHLLDAPDVHDLLVRMQVTKLVLDGDAEAEDVRSRALHLAGEERARLEEDAGSTARLEAEARDTAALVQSLLAEQEKLLTSADAEVRRLLEAEQAARAQEEAARAAAEELAKARARAAAAQREAEIRAASSGQADALDPGDLVGANFAAAPPTNGAGMTCPVGSVHSFTDTWNAPRSGGRRHQGTDVFAPEGSPAYAVADGVIDKASHAERGLGGITLWLRTDAGDRYYYAHNSANLVEVGQRVEAGDVIALVGRTGNARSTPPHVHFELHPGGGAAANPYALLRRLCG